MKDKRAKTNEVDKKALLICPNRKMAAEAAGFLEAQLELTEAVESKAYPTERALSDLVGAAEPAMCFLDICSDCEQALRLLAQLLDPPLSLPVVVLLSDNNPELVLRCLRRGAAGFLLQPFRQEELRPVLQRVADLRPAARSLAASAGKVYYVVPAKGSSGATTIASNLACQSKQLGVQKVLLADMDPLTSTLSFLLKLRTNYSFQDALAHASELDHDIWKALVTAYRGVDVLLSPENPLDGAAESHDGAAILEYCRSAYEVVFLDGGRPYGAWSLRLANASDEVLLVLTAEVPAVYSAQRALAHLNNNGVGGSKIRLIVNRHRKSAGLDPKDIEAALKQEVFWLVPNDRETVESALLEGRPVVSSSLVGRSLAELAAHLCGLGKPARKNEPGRLRSLFSR